MFRLYYLITTQKTSYKGMNEIADTFVMDGRCMHTPVAAQGQQVDVSKPMNMVLWTMQIGVAGMFCMAGGSKLSGSEHMVQLFQALGLGQGLRYFTGVMEVGGAVGTHLFLIGGNPTLPMVLLGLNAVVAWSRRRVVLSVLSRIVNDV